MKKLLLILLLFLTVSACTKKPETVSPDPTPTPAPEVTPAPEATDVPATNKPPVTQITPTQAPVISNPDIDKVSVTKIKKAVKNKKNKIQYSAKSVSKATGYEIQFSNSKSFKKILLKKVAKKPNGVISSKKLSKSKKLFIRVRVIMVTAAGRKMSDYSKAYKVKAK